MITKTYLQFFIRDFQARDGGMLSVLQNIKIYQTNNKNKKLDTL